MSMKKWTVFLTILFVLVGASTWAIGEYLEDKRWREVNDVMMHSLKCYHKFKDDPDKAKVKVLQTTPFARRSDAILAYGFAKVSEDPEVNKVVARICARYLR